MELLRSTVRSFSPSEDGDLAALGVAGKVGPGGEVAPLQRRQLAPAQGAAVEEAADREVAKRAGCRKDAVHLTGGEELLGEAPPRRGLGYRPARVELHVADPVSEGEEALDGGQLSGDGRRGQLAPRFEVFLKRLRIAEGDRLNRLVDVVDKLLQVAPVGALGVPDLPASQSRTSSGSEVACWKPSSAGAFSGVA